MAQMIDPNAAREHILVNYPNDPLLRTIALTLVNGLPKVEVTVAQKNEGCEYCTGDCKTFPTHCDGEAYIAKLIPLPAIDLMTGETEKTADPPFFAIGIQSDEMGEDFVPIRFCPKCGRELMEDQK